MMEDIERRQTEYAKVHEFYKPLVEKVTTFLPSFYETSAIEEAMTAETALYKTVIAPEPWPVKFQDVTTIIGGFQGAIDAGREIVSDIERRLSALNIDQITGYEAVWKNINFPNFATSAVGVLDDYIHGIEEEEEVDDGSLDEAKTILESIKNWRISLPQLSEKAVMGCAMATSDFALTLQRGS